MLFCKGPFALEIYPNGSLNATPSIFKIFAMCIYIYIHKYVVYFFIIDTLC